MKKYILFVGFLFAVLALSPRSAFACSCIAGQSVEDAYGQAASVFVGKATSVKSSSDLDVVGSRGFKITFDVNGMFKGPNAKTIIVQTAGDSAACGYMFIQGEEYLVYAHGDDGALQTGLCDRTKPAADAKDEIATLRDLSPTNVIPPGEEDDEPSEEPAPRMTLWERFVSFLRRLFSRGD